ncbi:MAG: rhodanese-like domain-containing protein [Lachnospiraceae bacterium]
MSLDFLSPKEVLEYIEHGDAVIIDIRDRESFLRGHIPGAFSVPSVYKACPPLRQAGH